MSVHISSRVWRHSEASGAALLVLLCLADQARDDGTCWPSVANIAERCRVSERSVHRYLDTLVSLGELIKTERTGHSSLYTVVPDSPSNPCQSGTPDNLAPLTNQVNTSANLSPTSATVGRQKHQETLEPLNKAKTPKKATAQPKGWKYNEKHVALALSLGVDLNGLDDQFSDHHAARGNVFKNWDLAFNTWIRNAAKFQTSGQRPVQAVPNYEDKGAADPDTLPWMRGRAS